MRYDTRSEGLPAKESEKLPSELASTLESIEDMITLSTPKKEFDSIAARRALLQVTELTLDWLARRITATRVYQAVDAMNPHFAAMDKAGATAHANRSLVFMNTVRRIIGRIDVVSRTGFLDSGYAILEVIVAVIAVLLMASRFKSAVAEYTLVAFITLVYVCMLRLIRDVDDPFEYTSDLQRKGAADVELFPIVECRDRAQERIRGAQVVVPAPRD